MKERRRQLGGDKEAWRRRRRHGGGTCVGQEGIWSDEVGTSRRRGYGHADGSSLCLPALLRPLGPSGHPRISLSRILFVCGCVGVGWCVCSSVLSLSTLTATVFVATCACVFVGTLETRSAASACVRLLVCVCLCAPVHVPSHAAQNEDGSVETKLRPDYGQTKLNHTIILSNADASRACHGRN